MPLLPSRYSADIALIRYNRHTTPWQGLYHTHVKNNNQYCNGQMGSAVANDYLRRLDIHQHLSTTTYRHPINDHMVLKRRTTRVLWRNTGHPLWIGVCWLEQQRQGVAVRLIFEEGALVSERLLPFSIWNQHLPLSSVTCLLPLSPIVPHHGAWHPPLHNLTPHVLEASMYPHGQRLPHRRVQLVIGNEQGAIADEGHRSYGKSRTIMIVNRFLPIPKLPRFLLSHPSFPIRLHRSSRIGRA